MTNSEAMLAIVDALTWLRSALRRRTEAEIYERLNDITIDWSLQPELGDVATILVKAWLEQQPESRMARRLLEEHLGGLGQVEELKEIETGGLPRPLVSPTDAIPELEKRFREASERMSKR